MLILACSLFSVFAIAQTDNKPPQKANKRPVVKAAATVAAKKPPPKEPFADATVAEMAKQCISFDTEAGIIEAEMYPEQAPETVRSFLNLVGMGMLDTTVFSRVVPGFVVQGGNLATSERITEALVERSRKTINDEPNMLKHERGILSMARPDEPNGASTHFFFLVANEAAFLDSKFTAFGRVTKGMDVVDKINNGDVIGDKPTKPVRITKATVVACPLKE